MSAQRVSAAEAVDQHGGAECGACPGLVAPERAPDANHAAAGTRGGADLYERPTGASSPAVVDIDAIVAKWSAMFAGHIDLDQITDSQLDALDALDAAAKPGPWRQGHVETWHVFCPDREALAPELGRVLLRMNTYYPFDADARLIAESRNVLRQLTDGIRARDRVIDELLADLHTVLRTCTVTPATEPKLVEWDSMTPAEQLEAYEDAPNILGPWAQDGDRWDRGVRDTLYAFVIKGARGWHYDVSAVPDVAREDEARGGFATADDAKRAADAVLRSAGWVLVDEVRDV